jgi:peptide deformylase
MTNNGNFLKDYVLQGEKLNIIKYPNPILKKKASDVLVFDEELRVFIKNLLFTMYNSKGIGLAAPQIGKSLRIFVLDIDYQKEKITNPDGSESTILKNFNPQVFINPNFIKKEGEIICEEGCLSLPGIFEEVRRSKNIKVEYFDMWGNIMTCEAEGLHAVCIQHENDHLEGIIFLERLSLLKRNLLKKKFIKNQAHLS